MFKDFIEALKEAMHFKDIAPHSISSIESNVGFIWFKAGEQTYFISIQKAEFDLDEYTQKKAHS